MRRCATACGPLLRRPTDGITIFYTDLDRSRIEVQRIPKIGRKAVDSNAIFIDGLFVPEEHRIGEEGRGFSYILDSLNPERVLVAMEAIGIGQDALRRAARYARERVVFDRPIGQNQGIQHPLAERWMYGSGGCLVHLVRLPRNRGRCTVIRGGGGEPQTERFRF
ncbi:MAG: acyl-CoA dehydrogenase family protein [Reyranella sp.]|uniref:acyl-CoA dehydrogenase family protein n=1 Tax=Reyranella sp. TaxID=1929291 RepID=UPI003D0BEE66